MEHFGVRDEASVGQGEAGGGNREAAAEAELEAGVLNEFGAESVEASRTLVDPWGVQDSAKRLRR